MEFNIAGAAKAGALQIPILDEDYLVLDEVETHSGLIIKKVPAPNTVIECS
jgi:hypothetical protein